MVAPQSPTDRDVDEFGFDQSRGRISNAVQKFVPSAVATRSIAVSVTTDREVYRPGEDVAITVEFRNRLPLPVAVRTPKQRLWGWTVDGQLEASDERRFTRSSPSTFAFRSGERKRVSFVWNGHFERTRDRHEWVAPPPGEYEIGAFVATESAASRPSDSTTVTIR